MKMKCFKWHLSGQMLQAVNSVSEELCVIQ